MATTSISLLALLMALVSSLAPTNTIPSRNQDLLLATEEMQNANYFTFVMLINMAPANLIQGNVTFLMPNDWALAKTLMPENAVSDFLLLHSIPSPLLFDQLGHFPTSSLIPTGKPELMLKVSNNGWGNFYLNNVQIVRPNVCTAGSSIRCHGIDGVVEATMTPENHNTSTLPLPTCSSSSSPAPLLPSPLPAPPLGGVNLNPLEALPPSDLDDGGSSTQKSGSCKRLLLGGFSTLDLTMMGCLVLLAIGLSV
ncbi:hypothetical protein RHMOL_Rhmol09G0275100 [Rhododendron molle]|uniref:Uncharacterized protein n=1 Tax=Rhododendron molle TaxID=49168 RepID=A0ACC0MHX9_RHOML|nr:hypothetical protein RHMOL_Rhmol09G0275100 [Rhododendron molle]